jgi:hypothetical protein
VPFRLLDPDDGWGLDGPEKRKALVLHNAPPWLDAVGKRDGGDAVLVHDEVRTLARAKFKRSPVVVLSNSSVPAQMDRSR